MINFNSPAFVLEAVQLLGIIMKEIVNSTMDKRTKLKHLKDKCAGYGFKYQDISKDLKELTVKFYCRNACATKTITLLVIFFFVQPPEVLHEIKHPAFVFLMCLPHLFEELY